MRLQRIIWLLGRILFYAILSLLMIAVIFSLVQDNWWTGLVCLVILIITIYKGLICLSIPAKSVVVRDGRVVFFVPEATVRNRFDFVTRGQSIVQLPDYQLLDRPFKVEIFSPGSDNRISSCRLSLRFGYLMQPAAWQSAYDCFVTYQDGLPLAVRKLLLKCCAGIIVQPVTKTGEDTMHELLTPVLSILNLELESLGLEVVDMKCSFTAGTSLARLVATEQDILDKGISEEVFSWKIRAEEGLQDGKWALLGVSGKNEL